VGRFSEWIDGRFARGKVLFTGKRRHLTSMEVRGVQIAEELGGACTRCRYLSDEAVASAPALVWIIEPDLELVERFRGMAPQFFDPINPRIDPSGAFERMNRSFRYLLLNTRSSINWLGDEPEGGWRSWVVPHHHCNLSGYTLPDERLARPRVVGYLGQEEHLHDREEIEAAVKKLGLEFRSFDTWDLRAYEKIDIGIAWTRRDELRDQTRSNIKLTNFAAHGIPSVVCNYESYRDVDARLGGAGLIRNSLSEFLEGVAQLAKGDELRRSFHSKATDAQEAYDRHAIAQEYLAAIATSREEFESRRP
jgi:hypothetical protein